MTNGELQKTILLVEDEVVTAMAGKIILEKYGNKVMTAHTGEEAVETVEKSPAIDLVLMDINLGAGIDGAEAAQIILRQRDLPVVFLSSHSEPEIVARTEKITSYGFVAKHSSHTVLDASIKMAFKLFEAKTKEKEKESQKEAALEALRESEEKYRTLVEKANEAITIAQDGVFIFANSRTSDLLGVPAGALEGKPFIDFVWPGDRELVMANYSKRIEGKSVRDTYDFRIIGAGGRLTWVLFSAAVIHWKGKPATLNLLTDITERKQVEQRLRESEERQQMILATLPIAIFTSPLDPEIDASWVSGDIEKVTGFTVDQYMAEKDFWRNRLHADDRERVLAAYKNPAAGDAIALEYRWLCKDGNYKWFYDRAILKHTRQGIQYFGIILDISKRKRAEEALRESEVRFRELFNRMSSGVAVYEAVDDGGDFIIRDFNPAAEKMEKVSKKDILGKRVSEVFPGVKTFGVFKVFQRVWQTGKAEYYPENICENEKNSGSFRESWRENWVFKLPAGEIVAIYDDITERKGAGEEIQRQLAEKEILLREVHHRIKNNIASIGGLISLQMQSVTNAEAIAVLKEALGRVNSMRILYDKLLLSEGYKDISVKNYIETLVASVVALFPDSAKVTINQHITDFQLDQKRLSPLGIIINELLTNIMKHAFINRDTGLIKISLTNIDKQVTLTIQDDGNGLPAGFAVNESKGFGLMLVKMLSQQLGGSFSIKMHEGTRCVVEFNI